MINTLNNDLLDVNKNQELLKKEIKDNVDNLFKDKGDKLSNILFFFN